LAIVEYQRGAWDDFLQEPAPAVWLDSVYLAIGNHELVAPKSRPEF
jgi:hypothetical protein